MALYEKLIPIEMMLNKNNEVVKFCEEALKYFESISGKREAFIRILACYSKSLANLKDFEKAIGITRKAIPLICMEEKNMDVNRFIIDAYNILVDSYARIGNEDEAVDAVLAGGKVIGKWFGGRSALEFYENILKNYQFEKGAELILKAFIELSEETLTEDNLLISVYNIATDLYLKEENTEKILEYAKKCLELAKKLNDHGEILGSFVKLAGVYLNIDPGIAKNYIEQGQLLVESYPDLEKKKDLEYIQYKYYALAQDYKNADECLENFILDIPESDENGQVLVNLYIQQSILNFNSKNMDKSLSILNKALEISDKYLPHITAERSEILLKIGTIYKHRAEYEKGLEYFINGLNIEESLKRTDFIPTILLKKSIMISYSKMNQILLAFEIGEKLAEDIDKRENLENEHTGFFYLAFGEICQKLNLNSNAKSCFLKALRIFKNTQFEDCVKLAETSLEECKEINN